MQYEYITYVLHNNEVEMERARKRAPGGGRKPIGATPARSLLTIRMPDHIRDALEAEARKNGWSLTQEILSRVRASLNTDHNDRALRALCFLITQVVKRGFLGSVATNSVTPWHLDPFIFRAFRFGVNKLLERLQPPGEPRPPELKPQADILPDEMSVFTPEDAAESVEEILKELFAPQRLTWLTEDDRIKLRSATVFGDPHGGEKLLDQIDRNFNAMASVKRDLGIKSKPREPKQ